jgi:hypothetical protein
MWRKRLRGWLAPPVQSTKGASVFRINRPALIAGAIAALALVPAASAAPPSLGDLNPPPPDFYTCTPVGARTICNATLYDSKAAEPQDGLVCGSGADAFTINDNGDVVSRFTRRYNADGNLTSRVEHEVWTNAFWSNPLTGKVVTYTQRQTFFDELTVPGDFSSTVEKQTGENMYTDPVTNKKVLRSAGRVVWGPDGLLAESGKHWDVDMFLFGDTTLLDDVCAALS